MKSWVNNHRSVSSESTEISLGQICNFILHWCTGVTLLWSGFWVWIWYIPRLQQTLSCNTLCNPTWPVHISQVHWLAKMDNMAISQCNSTSFLHKSHSYPPEQHVHSTNVIGLSCYFNSCLPTIIYYWLPDEYYWRKYILVGTLYFASALKTDLMLHWLNSCFKML